jgi:hypothetical protein
MVTAAKENEVRQVCNCGAEQMVPYELIAYKNADSLPQLVFPVCQGCESRVEFVFISPNMTKPEFQMFAQMQNKGLIK